MAFGISTPGLLLLAAAVQGMTLVSLAPQGFHSFTFTRAFICMTIINLSIWLLYILAIYPNFFSPLRDLPSPKVCDKMILPMHNILDPC